MESPSLLPRGPGRGGPAGLPHRTRRPLGPAQVRTRTWTGGPRSKGGRPRVEAHGVHAVPEVREQVRQVGGRVGESVRRDGDGQDAVRKGGLQAVLLRVDVGVSTHSEWTDTGDPSRGGGKGLST